MKFIRWVAILILVFIIVKGNWFLLIYWVVLCGALEFLNLQPEYLSQKYRTIYNLLAISYLAIIVWDRSRTKKFNPQIEYVFNSLEHIVFAGLVCFMILQFMLIFSVKNRTKRIILIALIFNGIGLLNEFYQNRMTDFPVFILHAENIKDLSMNLLGTALFLLVFGFQKISD